MLIKLKVYFVYCRILHKIYIIFKDNERKKDRRLKSGYLKKNQQELNREVQEWYIDKYNKYNFSSF